MITSIIASVLCISLNDIANSPADASTSKITVRNYVDTGVNFPYYLLARTSLGIPPFETDYRCKAFEEVHQKYGKFDVDWDSSPGIREVWWDWLWRVGFNGPCESPQQTIAHIPHPKEGDAEWNAAVEKLMYVANHLMPDYIQHWKVIQVEVDAVVQSMLKTFPTEEILRKNEEMFHRTHEPGKAFFYYNFFRTTTAQSTNQEQDGKLFHIYIVGLDYLRDEKGFVGFMAHELRHILINQSGVFDRKNIQYLIHCIHSLTKDWKDSSETGCVIENMNDVLGTWFEKGIDFDFSEYSRRLSRSGRRGEDIQIAKAFYDNRRVLADKSFEAFVEASLEQLVAKYGE